MRRRARSPLTEDDPNKRAKRSNVSALERVRSPVLVEAEDDPNKRGKRSNASALEPQAQPRANATGLKRSEGRSEGATGLVTPVQEKEGGSGEALWQECLEFRSGPNTDLVKAFHLCDRAARLNHVKATYRLAHCFAWGLGCEVNRSEALLYMKRASELGCLDATIDLVEAYNPDRVAQHLVPEYERNITRCLEYLERWVHMSCEKICQKPITKSTQFWAEEALIPLANHHAQVQFVLFRAYQHGLGAPKDLSQSGYWLNAAAKLKHPEALLAFGDIHLLRSAELGCVEAMICLAVNIEFDEAHESGISVPIPREEKRLLARSWALKARDTGHVWGEGFVRYWDPLPYWESQALAGNKDAAALISRSFVDRVLRRKYLQIAAELGGVDEQYEWAQKLEKDGNLVLAQRFYTLASGKVKGARARLAQAYEYGQLGLSRDLGKANQIVKFGEFDSNGTLEDHLSFVRLVAEMEARSYQITHTIKNKLIVESRKAYHAIDTWMDYANAIGIQSSESTKALMQLQNVYGEDECTGYIYSFAKMVSSKRMQGESVLFSATPLQLSQILKIPDLQCTHTTIQRTSDTFIQGVQVVQGDTLLIVALRRWMLDGKAGSTSVFHELFQRARYSWDSTNVNGESAMIVARSIYAKPVAPGGPMTAQNRHRREVWELVEALDQWYSDYRWRAVQILSEQFRESNVPTALLDIVTTFLAAPQPAFQTVAL